MPARNSEGGVVYLLRFHDNPGWAVGSTMRPLSHRKWEYYSQARDGWCNSDLYLLLKEKGMAGFYLETVVTCGDCDKRTLRQAEQDYWDAHKDHHCLNVQAPLPSAERNKHMEKIRIWRYRHKKRLQADLSAACDIVLGQMAAGELPHLELIRQPSFS